MALHGWRLFGVAGTIFAYVIVILFLSIINMQTSPLKRQQIGRYGELNDFHGYELIGNSRRQPIKWCSKLTFLSGTPFFPPLGSMKKIYASNVLNAKYKQFLKNYKNEEKKRYFVPQNNAADDDVGGGGVVRGQGAGGDGVGAGGYGTGNDIGARSDADSDEENNFNVNGLTALASFPGSGNTWLRYLLQQSTGILTGSIYKDYGLLKSGFPAESICNESVLVVKTHEWGPKAWEQFSKAILLVRDPDKAILAEFNRQSGGHVGFASPDRYKRTKGRYWQKFVRTKLNVWENMNLAWAKNFTGSLKIVFYDDLVNDVEGTLRSILEFLNFFINEETFACAMSRKEGIYRRRKRILSFDPYSTAMRKHIDQIKFKVYTILGRNT